MGPGLAGSRSEEHTSELQSLMRNSYAVFCLKKKQHNNMTNNIKQYIIYNTTKNPLAIHHSYVKNRSRSTNRSHEMTQQCQDTIIYYTLSIKYINRSYYLQYHNIYILV